MIQKLLWLITPIILMLAATGSHAQSLIRSNISCMGKSVTATHWAMQQTIGQSTVPGTVSAGGIDLRQGFIQPPGKKVNFSKFNDLKINLWPNPSDGAFTFILTTEANGDFDYRIYSVNGSAIHTGKGTFNQPVHFNEGILASGLYFLNITDAAGGAAVCKFSITR